MIRKTGVDWGIKPIRVYIVISYTLDFNYGVRSLIDLFILIILVYTPIYSHGMHVKPRMLYPHDKHMIGQT